MPLEIHVSKNINLDAENNNDVFFVTCCLDQGCSNKEYSPSWHQHYSNKGFVINDLQKSGLSVDKVTQFSLRPPEQ